MIYPQICSWVLILCCEKNSTLYRFDLYFSCRRKRGYTSIPDEENVSEKLTRDKEFQRLALKGSE